jgi:hypothetical protein
MDSRYGTKPGRLSGRPTRLSNARKLVQLAGLVAFNIKQISFGGEGLLRMTAEDDCGHYMSASGRVIYVSIYNSALDSGSQRQPTHGNI